MSEETSGGGGAERGAKYRAQRPKRTGWRRIFNWKTVGFSALGFFLLVAAGVGAAFALIDVPEPNDFSTSETTIVYFADGETELGRFSAENREIVDADEIPDTLKQAAVAAEDRSFYENAGFSVTGMTRAAIDTLRGDASAGGGSTITQQYVKNYYLTQDRALSRKMRELVISVKIDQEVDKDQILADYLNTIWFGRGTYGVQTAARAYFGVDVADVDLAQSAALAAILRSPARYDPTLGAQNAERFEQRFRYVLDGMVETGAIDQATADATKPPEIRPERQENRYGGPNGYLLKMVRDELLALGYDEVEIETGGLRVTASFDEQAQAAAVEAVQEQRPTEDAERVHLGLAAVRPGDGAIAAIYGGPDAVEQSFNDAVDAAPHAGSVVKPFTLAAALENGYSLDSRFDGNSPFDPPELGPPVNNQGDSDYGSSVSLEYSLENSINTAFVDLTMELGSKTVIDALTRAGVPEDAPSLDANPRVTLGIAGISALDMANSYATLASQGMHADPYTVSTVTDADGAVEYERDVAPERAFEEDVTADVTYALSETAENGTAYAAAELDRPVAAKTGTHQDLTAWFSGYTPQLAAAVTYFRGDGPEAGTESLNGVGGMDHFSGGAYPGDTWTAFMQAALDGEPEEEFPEPADIEAESDYGDDYYYDDDDYSDDVYSDEPTEDPTDDSGDDPSDEPTDEPTTDPSDEPTDEPTDDSGDETGEEWGSESGTDSGDDSGTDGGAESGTDSGTEGGTESGTEGGTESGTDSGTEGGTDTGTDSGSDTGTDSGSDTGTDSGSDTGTDTGSDTGTDSGTATGAESGPVTSMATHRTEAVTRRLARSPRAPSSGRGRRSGRLRAPHLRPSRALPAGASRPS